jgi:GNAT superfamily N-acetyltransferase
MGQEAEFSATRLKVRPVTARRWKDLVRLFGKSGACGGCWCMWWRQTRAEFAARAGESNRRALRRIVTSGRIPGLIAYLGEQPVGWCSIAPRTEFPSLDRSPVLKRVDEQAVWSLVCFFVARGARKRGVCQQLLQAAIAHARHAGARIVEAYPVDEQGRTRDGAAFTGFASTFRRAGFTEVARNAPRRPIMRLVLRPGWSPSRPRTGRRPRQRHAAAP